ncbi:acyl-CoA thioesterase [Radicibacter daui]|uniref:acyl-CoA thioesterase n=1 Tax=Radicibacter daui TaxID=3064829 RepID=UPI004046DEA7
MITARTAIKVQFNHLDPMGVVWHGNYIAFMEAARSDLLGMIGYNYPEMDQSGYFWPIVDMKVKYIRPGRFGQVLDIQTTLKEYENRLCVDYLIRDAATGEKMTKASTIQVAVEKVSGEMQFRSPDCFITLVEAFGA